MTTDQTTPPCVQRTARLSERLQQVGTAQNGTTTLRPQHGEREIFEDLNKTINTIIADTPMMLPEPIAIPGPEPDPQMNAALNDTDGMPTALALADTPFQSHLADAPPAQRVTGNDELQGWLTRSADDRPEPRSRTSVATLCTGVMLLSILAGYGTAQILNRSFADVASTDGEWRKATTKAALSLTWPSDDAALESDLEPLKLPAEVERVRINPVGSPEAPTSSLENIGQAAASASETDQVAPFNVAAASDSAVSLAAMSGSAPEPIETVETELVAVPGSDASTDRDASSSSEAPKLALNQPAPTALSGEDALRLFHRAERLIDDGDIAAARLMLRHLAEAGHGPAAFKLAQAYDPAWLADNSTGSIPPNRDLALRWYTMARDRGQDGAAARIDALERVQ